LLLPLLSHFLTLTTIWLISTNSRKVSHAHRFGDNPIKTNLVSRRQKIP
jgi:hypothetical protein